MTIRTEATRLVENTSNSVFGDTGLSTLCRNLKGICDRSPEEDLVVNVRAHLQVTYGTQHVLEQAHAEEWMWVWEPLERDWMRRKVHGSTFTINDGESHRLQAVLLVHEEVPL